MSPPQGEGDMSSPRGAVKYVCPCGVEYLIAIGGAGDDAWLAVVGETAKQLGIEVVDGSEPSFVCSNCGRIHARASRAAAAPTDSEQDEDE